MSVWDTTRLAIVAHALACYATFLGVLAMILARDGSVEPIVALLFVLSPIALPSGIAIALYNGERDFRLWALIAAYAFTFVLFTLLLNRRFRSEQPPGFPVLPPASPHAPEDIP